MKQVNVLWALLLALALAGCASVQTPAGTTPEEIVTKRAQDRWNLLLKPDYQAAYEYLTPGYREVRSYRHYLATLGSSVKRVSADVIKVACESEEVCKVNVEISYYYGAQGSMGQPGDTPISRVSEETWIKVDDQWWIYKDPK